MNPQIHENLLTYLNDHWAGSIGAVALVDDLLSQKAMPEFAEAMTLLRSEIENDQRVLKSMIQALGHDVDDVKSIGAWCAEKIAKIKLQLSHTRLGRLGVFEALEILALGIEGKRLLWIALDEYGFEGYLPAQTDLSNLILSAQNQGLRVQQWRLVAGRSAFTQNS